MSTHFTGPALMVHILIAATINAFLFPFIYGWAGSMLYAFLINVAVLCVYGVAVLWTASGRRR